MRISDWSSDVCSSDLRSSPSTFKRVRIVNMSADSTVLVVSGGRRCCIDCRRVTANQSVKQSIHTFKVSHTHGAKASSTLDRKSVVSGKSVSVRVDLGGRRIIKKKNQ